MPNECHLIQLLPKGDKHINITYGRQKLSLEEGG